MLHTFCNSSQHCSWMERHWCGERPSSGVCVAVEVTVAGGRADCRPRLRDALPVGLAHAEQVAMAATERGRTPVLLRLVLWPGLLLCCSPPRSLG